ncbi:DUF6397 family protein [Streptomyces griseorubiginosus]|uniref:DUF6397 family protein n=1 Tax=Streptomyces griseorubiginosus TaxID=67304 RepID=UPI0033A6F02B
MSSSTITQLQRHSCTPSRAARELGLKRSEFDLAVHLGQIRTVPDEGGGGRRVPPSEIDRLRATDGYPDSLRERVRLVGTTEGAKVMDIPVGRFTRLARLGLISPVRFYLNRYRAVVWLYLAEELEEFTTVGENKPLLTGRMPEGLRDMLDEGVDLRARNWRGRHRGFLLRLAEDPWESAGVLAAFLDAAQIAELVPDPYDRSHLGRFRPAPPAHGAQGSPAAHLVEKIMTADDPAEIAWLRSELAQVLEDARRFRPAPRPAGARRTPPDLPAGDPEPQEPPRGGLLGWLRRRSV